MTTAPSPGRAGPLASLRALRRRTPLSVTLVAALLLLVTVALATTSLAANEALRGYLMERVDDELVSTAEPIVARIDPRAELPRPRGNVIELPSKFYLQLADASGQVLDVREAPLGGSTARPDLPALPIDEARERAGKPFTVGGDDGTRWRAMVMDLSDGSGSIVVASNLDEVDTTLARLRAIQVAVGVVVLLLLAVVGHLVVRSSLRPLAHVEATAAAIAAGDLSRRVPERDPRTEVGRLARAINAMLGQIEQAFRSREASEAAARASEERMRRFVADASHELRTPLTSIRGFAELYRQGAVSDPADVARTMQRVESEAARMGVLVDDMLLLARLDQQRPLDRRPVDLITLAADAVHDARAVDPGRPVELEVRSGDVPPVVTGDEARLRQVLGNLVTNAQMHTPPGTPITVRVGVAGDEAVLEVADRGQGIPEQDLPRLFERFYRADPSRTRALGGSGLGLSIVAALVAAHGGTVDVQSEVGRGSTFRVRLPLRADSPSSPSSP